MPKRLPERIAALLLAFLLLPWAQSFASAVALPRPEHSTAAALVQRQLGAGGSYALVIGISQFDNRAWSNLAGVPPEIEMIETAFAQHGFDVVQRYDPSRMTKAQLQTAIDGFIRAYGSEPENRLVIYIATHGYKDVEDPEGYGYLVTSDSVAPGDAGFDDMAYSVRELSRDLTNVAAQHVYLFFNACFSGALMPEPLRETYADERAMRPSAASLPNEVARWALDLLSLNARLILTAGSDDQVVPDRDNPYARAVAEGLAGAADTDGDGLILGSELATYVRGRVARETRMAGRPNDAVFAILPKLTQPETPRADARQDLDYSLQGDFVFIAPEGPAAANATRISEEAVLEARRSRLSGKQFTECADCPVMVEMPASASGGQSDRIALARTETTFAEWDACYRDLGCRRYIPDNGLGRGDRPVGGVTWQDALEFEAWLDSKKDETCGRYRVPTRQEWLAGAGAGDTATVELARIAESGRAVCFGCGTGEDGRMAARSASQPANALGLHDMEGNLWEWVRGEEQQCEFHHLRETGGCAQDGMVIGGSFATGANGLERAMEGAPFPRTSNARPYSLPTVGLRMACEMR